MVPEAAAKRRRALQLAPRRRRRVAGMALAVGLVAMSGQGGAGHSVGHYPSYYPDEIRIEAMTPEAAGAGLVDKTLHAYVGSAPRLAQPVPPYIKSVKSLGTFLVLSFDAASQRFASAEARCAAARSIEAALAAETAGGFVLHPYPVTPYHADYLHHLDRIEAAKGAASGQQAGRAMPVAARGKLAEALVKARLGPPAQAADIMLEEVAVDDLTSGARMQFDGWSGPPWIKEGWFHAYRLLAPGLDTAHRQAAEDAYEGLTHGALGGGLAERADLERRLVAALTEGCSRLVVGYAPREEFSSEAYPPGAENIAFDAIDGLNAPIFVRTVKLKDYPWNGKLQLGVAEPPRAAWNPVAGFTDAMGRLLWSAVGDPAMIAFPVNASWMPNRVQSEWTKVEGRSGGIKVPRDALRPEPGTGLLPRAGDWAFASHKVTYQVIASPYDDGSEQSVADVLYPFAFLYRWGAKAEGRDGALEPSLEGTFAALDERLAGLEVVRVEDITHTIAEGLEVKVKQPVVDVYLRDAAGDESQVAALAPPWSTVPWHLLALMEEAVSRGYAAFSEGEARRRGVPWLDLARDPALLSKLQVLAAQFERESFRPPALKDLVSAEEAAARWRALRAYAEKNGHLLIANGPYRLKSWTPGSVAVEAVREMTYPLGFGTYDRFVYPPKAVIEDATQDKWSIAVHASADMILKGGRGTFHEKDPLLRTTARGTYPLLVVSRYLLIDGAGKVLGLDKMRWADDGHFTIDLPQQLPPGAYTVILGIFLDGNTVEPSAKVLHIRRIGASGPPG
jgi:hypothetical protein